MSDITKQVVDLLIEQNRHIAFAESCTGGLACGRLVDIPDASAVLDVSFVTYANEAKIKWLDVSPDEVEAHGVVSEEVAGAMACGDCSNPGSRIQSCCWLQCRCCRHGRCGHLRYRRSFRRDTRKACRHGMFWFFHRRKHNDAHLPF